MLENNGSSFETAQNILEQVSTVMIGQKNLLQSMLIGLLSDGHLLVEGVPGLAKTTAIKALSDAIDTSFSRIQFTPDLLPADLLGTQIYSAKTETFEIKKGPIFANLVLADEINRSPAKVQSALLEAMQEKQISIANETFKLDDTFLVMATQNPVEQEGTYPLPEAQLDRFMFKVLVDYPNFDEEKEVLKRVTANDFGCVPKVVSVDTIKLMRKECSEVFVDEKIYEYVTRLVDCTRNPQSYDLGSLKSLINYGASPRAGINFIKASKVKALLSGRTYVTPDDIKFLAPDIFRHRIALSYEADAQEVQVDEVITQILQKTPVP